MTGASPRLRLTLEWSCEVGCDCGAIGWERGYVTDPPRPRGIGTVINPMVCTCGDIPRDRWTWLWGYPAPGLARGEADTFHEALTALIQAASRSEP